MDNALNDSSTAGKNQQVKRQIQGIQDNIIQVGFGPAGEPLHADKNNPFNDEQDNNPNTKGRGNSNPKRN